MKENKAIVLIAFLLLALLSNAFAANPEVSVTKPSAGTYAKSSDTIEIVFTVKDTDVDGNSGRWLGVELYYSTTQKGFENFIGDYNLSDSSKEYCSDTNFLDNTSCSINWTLPAIADGNYYIDLNVYDTKNSDTNVAADSNKNSSQTFYVDNTKPTISFIYPDWVCDSILCTDNQRIAFDVNDAASGIDIATIVISIQGEASKYFNANQHCIKFNSNYRCDYNELAIVKNEASYSIDLDVKDKVGNSATRLSKTVKYLDTNAPVAVAGIAYEKGSASITVSWTANRENDLNGYRIYYTTQTCDFNKSNANYAGFTKNTSFTLTDLNSDKNYYIRVSAVDYSGNESELSQGCMPVQPNPARAPSAPTLTSSTHSNDSWSNKKDVTIIWQAVSGAQGYSCTWGTAGTDPDTIIDSNESYCTSRSLQQSNLSDGIYYLKVRACASNNNCSGISTFIVKIDTIKPSTPSNLNATLESDGDIKLTWSASSDANSGIKEYRIYRETSSGFTPSESNRKTTVTGTEWTDTDTEAGKTYYYKVIAVDNAGNESDAASVSITTEEISVTIDVPAYAKKGTITVRVRSSITLTNAYVYIKKEHDTAWLKIRGPITSSDFSADVSIESGDDGLAKIKVTADNLSSEVQKGFEIDTKPTEITWINPKPGESIKGKYLLKIKTDKPQTKIEKVTFYYNNNKIADVTQASEQNIYWVANWDTTALSPGTYSLKAVVLDKAGNEANAIISIAVESAIEANKEASERKLSEANSKKGQAIALLNGINSYGLSFSEGARKLYEEASQAMQDASNYHSQGNYEKALSKANEAIAKFDELASKYSFSEKESNVKDVNADEVSKLLAEQGYPQEYISRAINSTQNASAKKIVKVISVHDYNTENYYVKVLLNFKLNASNAHVIEFVPKKLAKSAAEISSENSFEVLQEDPVLLFRLENLAGETTLEYSIKQPFSKGQYEELKKEGAFAPTEFAIVEVIEIPATFGLPYINYLIIAIFAIVIIALLLFVYFNYAKTGMPKFGVGLKKEEPERRGPGRWAYKGK